MNTQKIDWKRTLWYNGIWLIIVAGILLLFNDSNRNDYTIINGGSFDQNVFVFVTKDTSMVREYSKEMDFNSAACTVGGDVIMVWFPEKPDAGLLAHEMTHVTSALLNNVGVPHSEDTEEVYAYEIQYLIKEFGNIK